MRVNKMITKEKMLWSFIKFSQHILHENVWRSVWRICMWILGLKGLTGMYSRLGVFTELFILRSILPRIKSIVGVSRTSRRRTHAGKEVFFDVLIAFLSVFVCLFWHILLLNTSTFTCKREMCRLQNSPYFCVNSATHQQSNKSWKRRARPGRDALRACEARALRFFYSTLNRFWEKNLLFYSLRNVCQNKLVYENAVLAFTLYRL